MTENTELLEKFEELKALVLLAIPDSRFPDWEERPSCSKNPHIADVGTLPGKRATAALSALESLVAMPSKTRAKRRWPRHMIALPDVWSSLALVMEYAAPAPRFIYRSVLENVLITRRGTYGGPSDVRAAIERLIDSGKVVQRALGDVLADSTSSAAVLVLAEDLPQVLRFRQPPPFSAADVRAAIRDGTQWWLDGGDWTAGPAGVEGDGWPDVEDDGDSGGWVIDPSALKGDAE